MRIMYPLGELNGVSYFAIIDNSETIIIHEEPKKRKPQKKDS